MKGATERIEMRVAVLSGKGGAGKTMLSVNLAVAAGHSVYLDCDVEEPNGYLFFRLEDAEEEAVTVPVPWVDPAVCNGCRECVRFCRFHALAYSGDGLMVFKEMCHSCGGCSMICPEDAITERPRGIGVIESGRSGDVTVRVGRMNVGEAAGLPIIRRLLDGTVAEGTGDVFIDCPPGSACTVMESIRDADFCVLVSEPTIFGARNLEMAAELVRTFGKPCGAVLNKRLEGEKDPSEEYCLQSGIPILGRIPYDPELGRLCSKGLIASREDNRFLCIFTELYESIAERSRA